MITLYEHQIKGKELLLKHKKYCLFFEVGTGKTFTALAGLLELPPGKVLIVAPKKVLQSVWLAETNFDISKHSVTYLNYEKIARDSTIVSQKFDYIILDEVHKVKGKSTKTSKRIKALTAKAQYVWGLTGTPQANNYADVYNIFTNMNIIEFVMSYNEFVARYYIVRSDISYSGYVFQMLICPKKENIQELMSRIGRHSAVKRLRDCVDLPDKRTDIIYVDKMLSEKYKEIKRGILTYDDFEKTMVKLEAINKLHQAANGFIYKADGTVLELLEKNHKFLEISSILEDMLEETERVIIVYCYKRDLELLKTLPYTWTLEPDDFPKKQILFLQFQQGEGLNLQYCNHMIYYTYSYSFLNFEQMAGRIYRTGQRNNVVYTILVSRGTIEEKILEAILTKKSRDEFLKGALSNE